MRKIEKLMIEAVLNKQDFRLDNTEVKYNPQLDCSHVYLHGHLIADHWYVACYNWKKLLVDTDTLAEYPSNTTLSRLQALGANVTVKKGDVFLDGVFIVNRTDKGY